MYGINKPSSIFPFLENIRNAMTTYTQKILRRKMRASGIRDVLIYCRDHRCSHHVESNADGWADDVRLSNIELNFTCTRCKVRPKFAHTRMGTG
jgi:hypothetical protein